MISDKMKKNSLVLSLVLATIIFVCLYIINMSQDLSVASLDSANNKSLNEFKGVYEDYNPGDIFDLYINVFATRDNDGEIYDLSAFDLIAEWDGDFNPVLDANIQFNPKGRQVVGHPINLPNAYISVRGNPKVPLKSYRVKYMDGVDGFQGQSVFNINKHLNDPSRIANKLAHDLIIDVDNILGFRTSFLDIYIRDNSLIDGESEFHSYGLYTHTEQPNKTYLRSRGLDPNGSIYRAENFYFQLTPEIKNVNDANYDKQSFETVLGIREGKDHTKLIQMLKDINDKDKNFDEVFHTYFNEDNYLTWLSVNILLGNADAMHNGFLLYNPSNTLIFYLMPWSFDNIFKWMESEEDTPNIYEKMVEVDLHRKYLEQDENVDKLKAKIEELISESFSPKKIKSLIKQYKPLLLDMMSQYPDNVLLSIPYNEQIAYLGQIDERILINYNEFMEKYDR